MHTFGESVHFVCTLTDPFTLLELPAGRRQEDSRRMGENTKKVVASEKQGCGRGNVMESEDRDVEYPMCTVMCLIIVSVHFVCALWILGSPVLPTFIVGIICVPVAIGALGLLWWVLRKQRNQKDK